MSKTHPTPIITNSPNNPNDTAANWLHVRIIEADALIDITGAQKYLDVFASAQIIHNNDRGAAATDFSRSATIKHTFSPVFCHDCSFPYKEHDQLLQIKLYNAGKKISSASSPTNLINNVAIGAVNISITELDEMHEESSEIPTSINTANSLVPNALDRWFDLSAVDSDNNTAITGKIHIFIFRIVNNAPRQSQYSHYYIPETREMLRIHCISWNVGNATPSEDLAEMFSYNSDNNPNNSNNSPDMYVVGAQECSFSSPVDSLGKPLYPSAELAWGGALTQALPHNYVRITHISMRDIRIHVFIRREKLKFVRNVQVQAVPTGIANIYANKGAVSVSFNYRNSRVALINCHLAAHQNEWQRRNADITLIMRSLFDSTLFSHFHHVILLGDLNYRLNYANITLEKSPTPEIFAEITRKIAQKQFSTLYSYDQLRLQQQNNAFPPLFSEISMKNIAPTFKLQRNKPQSYNSQRSPAYCDRILYHSMRGCANFHDFRSSRGCFSIDSSDHKPIIGEIALETVNYASESDFSRGKCWFLLNFLNSVELDDYNTPVSIELRSNFMENSLLHAYNAANRGNFNEIPCKMNNLARIEREILHISALNTNNELLASGAITLRPENNKNNEKIANNNGIVAEYQVEVKLLTSSGLIFANLDVKFKLLWSTEEIFNHESNNDSLGSKTEGNITLKSKSFVNSSTIYTESKRLDGDLIITQYFDKSLANTASNNSLLVLITLLLASEYSYNNYLYLFWRDYIKTTNSLRANIQLLFFSHNKFNSLLMEMAKTCCFPASNTSNNATIAALSRILACIQWFLPFLTSYNNYQAYYERYSAQNKENKQFLALLAQPLIRINSYKLLLEEIHSNVSIMISNGGGNCDARELQQLRSWVKHLLAELEQIKDFNSLSYKIYRENYNSAKNNKDSGAASNFNVKENVLAQLNSTEPLSGFYNYSARSPTASSDKSITTSCRDLICRRNSASLEEIRPNLSSFLLYHHYCSNNRSKLDKSQLIRTHRHIRLHFSRSKSLNSLDFLYQISKSRGNSHNRRDSSPPSHNEFDFDDPGHNNGADTSSNWSIQAVCQRLGLISNKETLASNNNSGSNKAAAHWASILPSSLKKSQAGRAIIKLTDRCNAETTSIPSKSSAEGGAASLPGHNSVIISSSSNNTTEPTPNDSKVNSDDEGNSAGNPASELNYRMQQREAIAHQNSTVNRENSALGLVLASDLVQESTELSGHQGPFTSSSSNIAGNSFSAGSTLVLSRSITFDAGNGGKSYLQQQAKLKKNSRIAANKSKQQQQQ
jgi:hypothetical protein